MAYSIQSNVIINDNREVLGVVTAGITSALFVGDLKIEDNVIEATSGVVTYVGDGRSLTGIVTVSEGAGGTPEFNGDLNIDGQLNVSGLGSLSNGLDVTGHIEGDSLRISGLSTFQDNVTIASGKEIIFEDAPALPISGVTNDLVASALPTQVVTADEVKDYVDTKIGGGAILELRGDEGVQGIVDLAANEELRLEGTDNQIISDINAVAGLNTVTFRLSDKLVLDGTLQVAGLTTFKGAVEFEQAVTAEAGLDVTGHTEVDTFRASGLSTFQDVVSLDGGANLAAGQALGIQTGTGVLFNVTHLGVSSSLTETGSAANSTVPSELAVKEYVDGAVTNLEGEIDGIATLRLESDDIQFGSINLVDEALGIDGTDGEVTVVGSGQTYTIGLPDSVSINSGSDANGGLDVVGVTTLSASGFPNAATTILNIQTGAARIGGDVVVGGTVDLTVLPGSQALRMRTNGGQQSVQFIGINTGLVENGAASDLVLPTEKAVKEYVDAQVGGNTNAETINTADNQDAGDYAVPFVSATGIGVSVYTDVAQLKYTPSSGLLVAQDFNSLSDIRFKDNVETIEDATGKLEQLRGVEFDWKNTEGSSVGVIAQEVMEVYPQLVTESEEKITVNYNGLTGLLIQAVKELSARVAELEGKA